MKMVVSLFVPQLLLKQMTDLLNSILCALTYYYINKNK